MQVVDQYLCGDLNTGISYEIIENLSSCINSDILSSHSNERLHEEEMAVSKTKSEYVFFRFAKKHSIIKQDIGPSFYHLYILEYLLIK